MLCGTWLDTIFSSHDLMTGFPLSSLQYIMCVTLCLNIDIFYNKCEIWREKAVIRLSHAHFGSVQLSFGPIWVGATEIQRIYGNVVI